MFLRNAYMRISQSGSDEHPRSVLRVDTFLDMTARQETKQEIKNYV